jgi:hypothetical protein
MSAPGSTRVGVRLVTSTIDTTNRTQCWELKLLESLKTGFNPVYSDYQFLGVSDTFFELPVFKINFKIPVAFLRVSHHSHFGGKKALRSPFTRSPYSRLNPSHV